MISARSSAWSIVALNTIDYGPSPYSSLDLEKIPGFDKTFFVWIS
jgi:hypothetical protein